jgi:hypothetical protein
MVAYYHLRLRVARSTDVDDVTGIAALVLYVCVEDSLPVDG